MNTIQPTKEPILYTEDEVKALCKSLYHSETIKLYESFEGWFGYNKKRKQ